MFFEKLHLIIATKAVDITGAAACSISNYPSQQTALSNAISWKKNLMGEQEHRNGSALKFSGQCQHARYELMNSPLG